MADGDDYIPLRDFAASNANTNISSSSGDDEDSSVPRRTKRAVSAAYSPTSVGTDTSPGSENSAVLTPRRFRGQTIIAHSTSTSKLSTLVDGNRQTPGTTPFPRIRNDGSARPNTTSPSGTSSLATFNDHRNDDAQVDGGSSTRAGSSFDSILNDFSVEEEALDNEAIANERIRQQQQQQQPSSFLRGNNPLSRFLGLDGNANGSYRVLEGGQAPSGSPYLQQPEQRRRNAGGWNSTQNEPIWSRRMLVLPLVMFLSMGLLAAVISTISWMRERTEHPKLTVNTHLFPYKVDRSALSGNQYSLRLIHTNDMHARFVPYDSKGDTCDPTKPITGSERCVGGAAYVKAVVDHLRLADGVGDEKNTILLNAGDEFQGTLFHVLFKGNVSAALLNAFDVDALALGNHEFDFGPRHLAKYLHKVHAPAICANLEFPSDTDLSELQSSLQPFTIVDRHKVGIIGVLTPETMSSATMDGVRITDPVIAINAVKAQLNKMGIHRIIVLSHLGYEVDMDLAARVDSGIGLIVGGHTHTYLEPSFSADNATLSPADGTPPGGAYPTWITNKADGDWQTAIVQAKSFGEYVGYLDLVFNDDGSLDSKLTRGAPIPVDVASPQSPVYGITPNKRITDILQPFIDQADHFANKRIGETTDEFPAPHGNLDPNELALGDLVADAVVWATRQHSKNGALTLLGTGSFRARIPKGEIVRGSLFTAVPFDDQIAAVSVPGTTLKTIVQATLATNHTTLSTLQVSGLRFNTTNIQVRTHVDNIDSRPMQGETWENLDEGKQYEVLAPMFLIRGGDNLFPEDMSANARVVFESYLDWVELYITRFSPISPLLDHRK
ncbi:hypothetical protein GGI15_003047 [Coemansia interrupta]|uniref:5'-nucleotidase n=1 Tax=Coemansia interrupta TaxID=1126814 RepID=A0A9W8HI39_9FUNG|nr:hypothetical protein GGI15_003047 [Coemansia interrupta]